jgi:hypothetical protein
MSLFSKIFDKFGQHKEQGQLTIIGTTEIAPPDPLSPISIPASKLISQEKFLPVARPTGPAPLSIEENNRNQSTMNKE